MHETETPSKVLIDTLFCSDSEETISESLENTEKVSSSQLNKKLVTHTPKVIIVHLDHENIKNVLNSFPDIQKQYPQVLWILMIDQLELSTLQELLDKMNFHTILTSKEKLKSSLKKALDDSIDSQSYYETLDRVRDQNKKLEGLNKNLESIVHERTMKEFVANQKTSQSLKVIQGILNFIKNMSRTSNVEEYMFEIRNEYKKVNGLMPPILLLENEQNEVRLFSFQGKQLVEKKATKSDGLNKIDSQNLNEVRATLTHFLGRPVGTINVEALKLQAEELLSINAYIIFENNLGSSIDSEYNHFMKDRWPITNMALENILIKDGLQNIAKQWSKTFNKIEDPILILDTNYRMSLSNGHFHRSSDLTCYQAFASSDRPCKDCPIQETFRTGETNQSDIHINKKVYRVHSYPIRMDGQDEVSHVINQYIDITQSIDLQSRVVQGEKMAAVGLLAGNIAHELNNPLTGIFSLSQLLMDDFEKESNTYKDMDEIKMAAARCQRIIKDLLDFSDLESESRVGKVEVNVLINKTLPLLKMALRMMNSDIRLSESELWIEANPQLIQQVIFNLINNACQAMEEGGTLTVITKKANSEVSIYIKDTGSGIPDEIKDSVFDPFFTTKTEGKGTGLGLSMSRSVIERSGGRLQLNESNENGTEFQVILPEVNK